MDLTMPTAVTRTATTATTLLSLFRRHPTISVSASASSPPSTRQVTRTLKPPADRRSISCQVALTTEVSSSVSEEETEALARVGKRIRVKVPLKVYHVSKAKELDLCGMEGVIKQYVGLWKGKRISANLPFKVEFFVSVEGIAAPIKFFAHLKEDEFEFLPAE